MDHPTTSTGSGVDDEDILNASSKRETLITSQPLPSNTPSSVTANPHIPSVSASAVLGESASMPEGTPICKGFDFNTTLGGGGDNTTSSTNASADILEGIINSMKSTGFQATNLGMAIDEINRMRNWRLSDVPFREGTDDEELRDPAVRSNIRARVFFAYTSNQISCGQREIIRFIVQHGLVDCIVTTAGGIEEDIIKCFEPTFMGDFKLKGKDLRKKGINRIGNLLVPNNNYCKFEDWMAPLIVKMHDEQDEKLAEWAKVVAKSTQEELPPRFAWTPSKVIERIGNEINNEESVLYWAAKNQIPVFCPALTDGSVGDMMYFHSYKRPGFVLDINEDIRRINDLAVQCYASGMLILGGGLVKHHTCNANLMRNGADFSVYINTGQEFDGSDSGASPEEAISWGKIRIDAKPVKVCADATIAFPLIVSQTFAKDLQAYKESTKDAICWMADAQE